MKVQKNTIVSLKYRLTDAQDNLIEESAGPMIYLHGGYDGTFPKIEEAVDGHDVGYETTIQLEPADAFGDYDPDLLKIEPRSRFPEPLEVGMQFEGLLDDDETPVEEEDDEDEDNPWKKHGKVSHYEDNSATIVDILCDKKYEREGKINELNEFKVRSLENDLIPELQQQFLENIKDNNDIEFLDMDQWNY